MSEDCLDDPSNDPDVILLRKMRTLFDECVADRPREFADQLTGLIVTYVESELCRCLDGTVDCPLRSHR